MFDALEAHTTDSFEITKEHRAEGHTSVVNYQKHHNHVRGPEAARRLTWSIGSAACPSPMPR